MHTQHFESPRVLMRTDKPTSSRPALWLSAWLAISVTLTAAVYWTATTAGNTASVERHASPTNAADVVMSVGLRHSHNGRYTAEVVAHSALTIGAAQSWTVHLEHRARHVAHASVRARAWMPEGPDGASDTGTELRYVGDGNYRIDDLRFSTPGWWNVALVIDGVRGADSVAFNVVIPEHRTNPLSQSAGKARVPM